MSVSSRLQAETDQQKIYNQILKVTIEFLIILELLLSNYIIGYKYPQIIVKSEHWKHSIVSFQICCGGVFIYLYMAYFLWL